jgi:predicted transcriptional regulator of viral defense system
MNNKIIEIAKQNGNLITTAQARQIGLSNTMLSKYVANGSLCRVHHGIYALSDTVIDYMYVLNLLSHWIVISHESALFLNGISDRTPFFASVTIPSTAAIPHSVKKDCACFYIQKDLFEIGLEYRKTTFGNLVRCYNMERTICDILRSRSRLDDETVVSALKKYAISPNKDLYRLYEYAPKFSVLPQIKKYLEVLL